MADWRKFNASNQPHTCLWCGRRLRRRTTSFDEQGQPLEHARPLYDAPGDYGDGFFCGLRCAYQYAVVVARAGQRLRPRRPEESNHD